MFTKINQISGAKLNFLGTNKYLFVPKKDKGFIIYDLLRNISTENYTEYDVFEILLLSENTFIVTESYARTGFMYEFYSNKPVFVKDLSNYTIFKVHQKLLYVRVRQIIQGEKIKTPGLYNWREDRVLWQNSCDFIFVSDYLITRDFNAPSRISINTGEILWTYNFERYPKTKNIRGKEEVVSAVGYTGVVDNKLWVSLNTLQHLVLDIDTGEQIALLGQPYKYNKDYYAQKVMSGGQIDEKQNKIISLGNCQYREINTDTFEATFIDLREEFDKYGVSSVGDTRFDDNYIYFYDKIFFGEQPRNKVAVLDRHTLKVVWVHDFAQYGTFPMQMEKTDRHLFVLDSGGTLHIFEKEEKA